MALGNPTVIASPSASTTASTTRNFSAQAAGTYLILYVVADDYDTGDPSGWTIPAQTTPATVETQHGGYVWINVADGSETSVTYVIGSATNSESVVVALSGADATVDGTNAVFTVGPGSFDYASPSVTPTAGNRCAMAFMGANGQPSAPTATSAYTNSYTEIAEGATAGSGTNDALSVAYLIAAFDGSTATTTTATWSTNSPDTSSGITVVFKEAAAAGEDSGPNAAGASSDLGGGSGSWANVSNATGAANSAYAVWTAP